MPDNTKSSLDINPNNYNSNPSSNKRDEFYEQSAINTPTIHIPISNYLEYGESQYDTGAGADVLASGEYNELRGQRQSGLDKAANGVVRAAAKIVPRAIEGVVNPFYGSIAALTATDKDGNWDPDASKFWDNALTNGAVAASQYLDKQLPLYATKEAEQAKGFEKLLYANTWAGDILDGMSYSAAAMVSGGLFTKAAGLLGKMSAVGKAEEFLSGWSKIDNAADAAKYISNVENTVYNIKDGLNKGMSTFIGASTEASDNALSDSKEWYNSMKSEIESSQGFPLTDSQKEWLDINRKQLGNTSFALNIPVIMADNWLTFGKSMLSKKSVEKELLKDVADKSIYDVASDSYTRAIKSSVDKILEKTYGIRQAMTPMLAEGLQEVEQLGVSKGVQDYYTKKYYNPDAASFVDSFGAGFSAAMSKEGLESFLVGAISSGIFGNAAKLSFEGTSAFKDQTDNITKSAIEYLNKNKTKPVFQTMVDALHRHANLSQEYDNAVELNNDFEAMNKASDMIVNHITSKVKTGKLEDFKKQLASFNQLTPEEFETSYGVKLSTDELTGMKQSVAQFIKPKLEAANKIEKLHSSLENMFPDAPENIKDRLLYTAYSLDDSADRANTLNSKIQKTLQDNQLRYGTRVMVGDQLLSTNYFNLSIKDRANFVAAIEASDISPLDKEAILANAKDIDKLDERRLEFIKEYKKLKDRKSWEKIVKKDTKAKAEVDQAINDFTSDIEDQNPEDVGGGITDFTEDVNDEEDITPKNGFDEEGNFWENGILVDTESQLNAMDDFTGDLTEEDETPPEDIVEDEEISEALNIPDTKPESIKAVTNLVNADDYKDEIYPGINAKDREKAVPIKILTSSELQDLVKSITKAGKNINDLVKLKSYSYTQDGVKKKSVGVILSGKLIGMMHLPEKSDNESLNQIFHAVRGELTNKQTKDLGFGLIITQGSVNFTTGQDMITLDKLNIDLSETGNKPVILDRGARVNGKYSGKLTVLTDNADFSEVDADNINFNNYGRYVLAVKDNANQWRYIPTYPTNLAKSKPEVVSQYIDDLKKSSNKVSENVANKKDFDKTKLAEHNKKISKDIFIAVPKVDVKNLTSIKDNEGKERSVDGISISLEVEPNYGNVRINVVYTDRSAVKPVYVQSKAYISNKDMQTIESTDDLVNYINLALATKNIPIKLTKDSFRQNIGKSVKKVATKFEAAVTPDVFSGQRLIMTANKDAVALKTVSTKSVKVKEVKKVDSKSWEQEAEDATKEDPKGPDLTSGTIFKSTDEVVEELISPKEVSDIERILPKGIEVKTVEDIKQFLNNVSNTGTVWGFFRDKLIYLSTAAGQGTGYHEAFHAIFRYGLSDAEVKRFLLLAEKEILKTLNTPDKLNKALEDLKAKSADYSNLAPQQLYELLLEEYMADKFMEYKNNQKITLSLGLKELFRRLWNMIKNLVKVNTELESLYGKIDSGAFSNSEAKPNRIAKAFVGLSTYKNIPASKDTYHSQSKSKKMINTYAALIKHKIDNDETGNKFVPADVLTELINERINNLKSKAVDYINSIENEVTKDKLIQSYKDELYALENKEARKILREQILAKFELFGKDLQDTEDDNNDGSNNTTERFGNKDAWQMSLEESLPKQVREYISFSLFKSKDVLTGEETLEAVDPAVVFNGLSNTLANTPEDQMLNKWISFAKDNVQAAAVLESFMNDTGIAIMDGKAVLDGVRNHNDVRKIVNAFKKIKVAHQHTELRPVFDGSGLTEFKVKVYNANTNDPKNIQFNNWANNIQNIKTSINPSPAIWRSKVESAKNVLVRNLHKKSNEATLSTQISDLQEELKKIGIELSKGYLRYSILKNKQIEAQNEEVELSKVLTKDQINYLSDYGDIAPLDSNLIKDEKAGLMLLASGVDIFDDKVGIAGRLKTVAEANSQFDESIGTSNFKGPDGNTRYDIIFPSYVLNETINIHDSSYREKLKEDEFLKDNLLLQDEYSDLLDNLKVNIISGLRNHNDTKSKEGKVFGDYDEREFILQNLAYFFAQKAGKSFYVFRQNEASNTAYVAELPVNNFTTKEGNISDVAIDRVYKFFEQEFNRISSEVKKGIGEGKIYKYNDKADGRAYKFFEFAYLKDYLSEDMFNMIMSKAKSLDNNDLNPEEINAVKAAIKENLDIQIKKFTKLLQDNEFGVFDENGVLTYNKLIPTTMVDGQKMENKDITVQLKELYLNDYIYSFSLNQLYDGDYAKSRKDFNDIVKRNKGAMGSGVDLGSGTHRVAFIKDVNEFVLKTPRNGNLVRLKDIGNHKYVEESEYAKDKSEADYVKVYTAKDVHKINSNDAQSYTTINHAMFMINQFGKGNKKVVSILRKIRRGVNITDAEQGYLESNGASLNPFKTVTFGRGNYIKTSEAIIDRHEVSYIKDRKAYNALMDELEHMENNNELTKEALIEFNKELIKLYIPVPGKEYFHNILNQMDIHGIDQVVTESASKGETYTPLDSLDFQLNLSKSMKDIPNEFKRNQVETPTGKTEITSGTQLMQLIDSEQDDNLKVGDQTLGQLRTRYRELMSKTRSNDFAMAVKYIKATEQGVDTTRLEEKFKRSLEESGATDQLKELMGKNWNLLPVIDKAEQLFLAHFSKGVLAQKVPGTKVALMSDTHFRLVVDKEGNIIRNNKVKQDPKRYSDPARYSTRKLKHNIDTGDGTRYSECILSERVFTKFGLQVGDVIPDELATMLGYRIPTQDKHSMISLKVVDTLPKHLEGTGIFPQEIVLLSGADFDIDSLFIQTPSFYVDENGNYVKYGTEKTDEERFKSYLNYYKGLKDVRGFIKTLKINDRLGLTDEELFFEVLKQLDLPTTLEQFKKKKDLVNGALNNEILDIQIKLLTNSFVSKEIAYTPASVDALEDEVEFVNREFKKTENIKEAKKYSSPHGLTGKIQANSENSAGKAGIGIVANALQAFVFLAKNKISGGLRNVSINGKSVKDFEYIKKDNIRIADFMSTILSVFTDNAKDPKAGKIGIAYELLGTYAYLAALGVDKNDLTIILNTPSIKEYARILKVNKASIQTLWESKRYEKDLVDGYLQELVGNPEITSDEIARSLDETAFDIDTQLLLDNIKNPTEESKFLFAKVMVKVMQIKKQAEVAQDLNNIIKLTKGLPTSFNDVEDKLIESLYKLGLKEEFNLPDNGKVYDLPVIDIKEAVKADKLLYNNIALALKAWRLSSKVFITQTTPFKAEFSKLLLNLKPNIRTDIVNDAKRSFLGFISTRGYKNMLAKELGNTSQSEFTNNLMLNTASDELIYSELGSKTLARELIEMKNSSNEKIRENLLIKWLDPKLKYNEETGEKEDKFALIDIVSGKSFVKLSTENANDLVDSFDELFKNPETREFAIKLFNYLLVKDNFEFKNNSFSKYLAPYMFNRYSESLNKTVNYLSTNKDLEELFGVPFTDLGREFRLIFNSYRPNHKPAVPFVHGLNKLGVGEFTSEKQISALRMFEADGKSNLYFDKYFRVSDPKDLEDERLVENRKYLNSIFDSRKVEDKTGLIATSEIKYVFPEFIKVLVGKESKLFKLSNSLINGQHISTNALYEEVPMFGFATVSPYGKTYEMNLATEKALDERKAFLRANRAPQGDFTDLEGFDDGSDYDGSDFYTDTDDTNPEDRADFTANLATEDELTGAEELYDFTEGVTDEDLIPPGEPNIGEEDDEPQFSKKELSAIDKLARRFNSSVEGFFSKAVDIFNLKKEAKALGYDVKETSNKNGYYIIKSNGKKYTPSFSKLESKDRVISEVAFREIADKLSAKTGVEYTIVTTEEALELLKELSNTSFTIDNVPAFYHNNQVVIPDSYMTSEVAFHEFGHAFVDAITKENKALFSNLKSQLQSSTAGNKIINDVKKLYPELVKDNQLTEKGWKEAITQALGKIADGQIKSEEKSLLNALKQLLKRIGEMLGKLFNVDTTINPIDLKANTTLAELANMLKTDAKINLSTKSEGTQFSKKDTISSTTKDSAFKAQYVFFTRRISTLTKKLSQLTPNTEKYHKLESEIEDLKKRFSKANEDQSEEEYTSLGSELLDVVDGFITQLEEGKNIKDEDLDYTIDIIQSFTDFDMLKTRTALMMRRVYPFLADATRTMINDHATEPGEITQDQIDRQVQDIGSFKASTGALLDLANYIARTIGSVIKSAQNRASLKNKKLTKLVQSHVDDLTTYGKTIGKSLDELYELFIQESNNDIILTSKFNDNGSENENFKLIQETPELLRFYNFYQDTLEKAEAVLPTKFGKHFIPNIPKSNIKTLLKNLVSTKYFKEGGFIGTEGLYADIIETKYHDKISIERKSRDLGASLLLFSAEANTHSELSKALPKVRLLQHQLLYKQNASGHVVKKEYVDKSSPDKAVHGKNSKIYKMVDTIIDMQLKGEMKKDQLGVTISSTVNDEGEKVEKKIFLSDVADVALKYNSMLRIGFAPITAAANILFGDLSNIIEAVGGRHFGIKDLHRASWIFGKQVDYVSSKKASPLYRVLEELNPLQELDDYNQVNEVRINKKMSHEKLQEYMYSMQKKGELFLQSRVMIALLLKEDYMDKDGNLTKKYEDLNEREKQQLSDKIQRLNEMIHGRYSQREAAALQQNFWYRIAIQFRKWIPAAVENRLGDYQYDNRLGTETEGRYRTFYKLLTNLKDTSERLKAGKMTKLEIYNMKKMLTEVILMTGTMAMYAFLHGDKDDEEAKKRRKQASVKVILTLLNRASNDLSFFYSPEQLNHLVSNSTALTTTVKDVINAVSYLPHAFYGEESSYTGGPNKGSNKFYTSARKTIVGVKPIQDIYTLFNDNPFAEPK